MTRRIEVPLDREADLALVDDAVETARRHGALISLVAGQSGWGLSAFTCFEPACFAWTHADRRAQAHRRLLRALELVPTDVAASGRVVDGTARSEIRRIRRRAPRSKVAA